MTGSSRWDAERGGEPPADYDEKWRLLAAAGQSVHGEADFVCRSAPASVLDAGCGTGRVAIELAARGIGVVGVDLDPVMLAGARSKAPDLEWIEASLDAVELERRFDVIVLAGNVMIYLRPGTEAATIANLATHLAPDGRLIAGFQLDQGYGTSDFDGDCAAAGLQLDERFATWGGDPWAAGGAYAVSVHRRRGTVR